MGLIVLSDIKDLKNRYKKIIEKIVNEQNARITKSQKETILKFASKYINNDEAKIT